MPSLKTTSVEDLAQATVSCFALWVINNSHQDSEIYSGDFLSHTVPTNQHTYMHACVFIYIYTYIPGF